MNPREGGPVGFSEASERADERPDGLGDVIAVGPVNVRVQPCGGGADVTLPHEDAPLTTGQLWLDEHGQTAGTDVQTGLML